MARILIEMARGMRPDVIATVFLRWLRDREFWIFLGILTPVWVAILAISIIK